MKKLLTLLLTGVLMISICTTSFAADFGLTPAEEQGLLIETAPVPDAATEYAVEVFKMINSDYLRILGLSEYDINSLSLTGGYLMVDKNTMQYTDNIYYFNILSDEKFIATIIITNNNNNYGYQIEKTNYAKGFNKLRGGMGKIYKAYEAENAYYFVSGNEVIVAASYYEQDSDIIMSEIADLKSTKTKLMISNIDIVDVTQPIASSNTNMLLAENEEPIQEIRFLNAMLVPNTPLPENRGACWAACISSIYGYYQCLNNPGVNLDLVAYRDYLVEQRIAETGSSAIGITDSTHILNNVTGMDYRVYGSKPPFDLIQYNMMLSLPIFSTWHAVSVDGNNTGGHAMVIYGCTWLRQDPGASAYQSCLIMDPNKAKYNECVILRYDSLYVPDKSITPSSWIMEFVNGSLDSWENLW